MENKASPKPPASFDSRRSQVIILLLLGLFLLLPGTNIMPLLDRDEPRFARATEEMMQRGEWIIPYFNDEHRFDKPVLTYWLMRAGYAAAGVSEFGARLHAVAAALALVLTVYAMGRRWFSPRVGFLAAAGLLTCLQMMIHGRAAVADMPMVLFVTTAQWAAWQLLQGFTWRYFFLLYVSLGFGFLAKGPIAWIVPVLTMLLFRCVFWRQPAAWRNLRVLPGLALTLLIAGAWGVPALLQTQGQFWHVGIGEHVVERGKEAFNGRKFLPIYYPLTAIVSLFPWSAYAGWGWQTVRKSWSPLNAFLAAWFIAPFLVFTCYATQLPHYVFPAFPAFFLLLSQSLGERPEVRWAKAWKWAVMGLFTLPVLALCGFLLWPDSHLYAPGYSRMWLLGAAFLALGLGWLGRQWQRPILATGGITVAAAGMVLLGAGLRLDSATLAIQPDIDRLPPQTQCASFRYREPSLVFYTKRNWQVLGSVDQARAFLAEPGPRVLIMQDSERPFGSQAKGRSFDAEVRSMPTANCETFWGKGFNPARGKFVTLRGYYHP